MASSIAIVILCALLGIAVEWRLPGLQAYTQDRLTRARGPLPVPDDIAIVAIDDASVARFGRFPWPRSVLARAIDAVAAGQPRAIAIDVLFPDSSTPAEDAALARSIARAGNVATAAELIESGPASWLLPLPEIRSAAAATGHINVLTESDGAARHLLLLAADDAGTPLRALPLEAIRIAERLPENAVVDTGHALVLG
ncbi:MAG: CHASE2 domain-containing protein, partial [Acidobacteria bacterium]|nr:CHASE2 domain-containing protein [Acidobacteriota bacterium]